MEILEAGRSSLIPVHAGLLPAKPAEFSSLSVKALAPSLLSSAPSELGSSLLSASELSVTGVVAGFGAFGPADPGRLNGDGRRGEASTSKVASPSYRQLMRRGRNADSSASSASNVSSPGQAGPGRSASFCSLPVGEIAVGLLVLDVITSGEVRPAFSVPNESSLGEEVGPSLFKATSS